MNSISRKSRVKSKAGLDATLHDAGTRVTSQRALILEIIQHGQGHLDVDEIHRRAHDRQPRLSLSTVYRTIQVLKKLGLVEEVHIDATRHHYEAKQATDHYHLVCLGCGRVIEFSYPLVRQIKKSVTEAKGFDIVNDELRATGYCPKCRAKSV